MGRLAGGIVLPLPFYSLVLVFSHMVHLCYKYKSCQLLYGNLWGGCAHILCTSSPNSKKVARQPYICMGGRTHGSTLVLPCCTLMRQGRGLRVATRFAPVNSTGHDASINESLKHELYQKFLRKRTGRRRSPLPKFGPLCIATSVWRRVWLLPMQCSAQCCNGYC